jgi:hypothetical protein
MRQYQNKHGRHMSFSPYFPHRVFRRSFSWHMVFSLLFFPTGFLEETIPRMIDHKDKQGLGGVLGFIY